MAANTTNVKDALTDLLMQEKDIYKVYASFLPEAACPQLRTILTKNMDMIAKQQLQIFQMMQEKGLYQVKEAEAQAVAQAKQQFASSANS